ncbi:MAG TPA: AI-2E family transporter [bacterium]
MPRDRLLNGFFLLLLAFIVYQVYLVLSPFINSILWAGILAFACYPLQRRLIERARFTEPLAALTVTVILAVVLVPPVLMLVTKLAFQAAGFYQQVAAYVQEGHLEEVVERVREMPLFQQLQRQVAELGPAKSNFADWLLEAVKGMGNFSARQAGLLTRNLLLSGLSALLTFALLYVFLRHGPGIVDFIHQVTPLRAQTKQALFGQINETLAAVIRGQVLTGIAQGILSGIIFWLIGVPFPVLFGALTFLAALLPVAGASMVWLPLVVYLLVQQEVVRAGILFVLGVAGISLVDNLLKPALIGERTKLPYLLLFLGILGGIRAYGLIGVFLAPVVLTLFFSLVTIYREEYLKP